MANYIYIATSLDGFIARKNGSFDWLLELPNPDGSDFGFADFMENIDAVVMGKNTFEIVLKFDEWFYNKPVFVLSSSLKSIPDKFSDKAELLNTKPDDVIKQLNSRGFNNLYIDGGKTIQDFLRMELIDEMIVTRIPILIGEGIPLFGSLPRDQKFEHIKTEILLQQSVKSYYKKIRE
jgi:dihydrofolate reductase